MSASEIPDSAGDLAGRPRDKRVGELLIEEGLISDEQLKQALETQLEQGGKLFEVLIGLEILTKESLHSFLSRQSGVPAIDLRNYEIPRELVPIIPDEFAREHVVLPIDKLGKLLTVGMACPLDTVTIHDLERLTGLRVKAMLCKLDDIQAKISRYYPVREEIEEIEEVKQEPPPKPAPAAPGPVEPARPPAQRKTPPRQDAVDKIVQAGYLPPVTAVVQQLAATAANSRGNLRDMAAVACGDPAFAAKLLSITNAVAYGMAGNVTNVFLAATLLGNDGVGAVAADMNGAAPAECPAFKLDAFKYRSVFCAKAAAAAAGESGRVHPSDAYTAGLLHDVGRLALAHILPEDYAKVGAGSSILDVIDGELEVFGFTHAEAGYRLAAAWGLPSLIAGAVRTHHDVEALKLDPLAATVAVAAILAEAFERNETLTVETLQKSPGLLAQSGIGAAGAIEIHKNTAAAMNPA